MLAAFEFPPVSHLFVWRDLLFKGTPFAVNKTVILIAIGSGLVLWFFLAGTRRRAVVPTGVQNLAEMSYELVETNISAAVIGADEGKSWTPFLASLFFFIFALNIFEVIPFFQFPPTSRIALPLFLALMVWLLMLFLGFKHQGLRYLKNTLFPPGVPKALMPLFAVIEFVSVFIVRPFSHTVRLFANMMAGHILLTLFALLSAALWLQKWNAAFIPLPILMGIAMTAFEVLVAVLQAYIFTVLAAVYIADSLHPGH